MQDLARELKKMWNMKAMVMPIVNSVLRRITRRLVPGIEGLEIRGRVETIRTTLLLRLA